jgi:hypothetical protein
MPRSSKAFTPIISYVPEISGEGRDCGGISAVCREASLRDSAMHFSQECHLFRKILPFIASASQNWAEVVFL